MKQASPSSTKSGISPKKSDNFKTLRLYLILGSLLIFTAFAVYAQILIRKAKHEQEYVPRIFAQYIAYTDKYLRLSEQTARMVAEITSKRFESLQERDFEQAISNYMLFEFPDRNPIPVIIADADSIPQYWNRVKVPSDVGYDDLSQEDKQILEEEMGKMDRMELREGSRVVNQVFIAKPISLEDFIRDIDYSVVVTDRDKIPLYWRNVDISENVDWFSTDSNQRALLLEKMQTMVELPLTGASEQLGYIYFTAPKSLSRISSLVILELLLIVLIVAFGTYGLILLHRTEKDTLWVGLAKETSHQFATPITSLLGWLDYLRETPPQTMSSEAYNKILDQMTVDLDRLSYNASRFGKVGSQTKLVPLELHSLLQEIVDYHQVLMPHLSTKIELHFISKIQGIKVMLDKDLFKWAMENLIKNCVDAMTQKGGNIFITATHNKKYVYVHVRDEGKGIPRSHWKNIFDPGVTSKQRGWGLGLSLARRSISEYHRGQIRVLDSTLDEGSNFEIRLNKPLNQ